MKIHIVRQGDTLRSVAARFDCPVNTLAEINMLPADSRLVPGLALCAPSLSERRIEVLGFHGIGGTFPFTFFSSCDASTAASGTLSFDENGGIPPAHNDVMPIFSISLENSHDFLHDRAAQEAFLAQLFPVLTLRGFRAVLLESAAVYSFDADVFRSFLTLLSAALHSRACFLFTVIGTGNAVGLFDGADCAAIHNELADRIILDTDRSPLSDKEALIEKISSDIDSRRLLLGFDAQAVKLCGNERELLSSRTAMQLALSAAERIDYDPLLGTASFCCGDFAGNRQRICLTDPRGLNATMALADRFSLAGIAPRGVPVGINALNIKKFIS